MCGNKTSDKDMYTDDFEGDWEVNLLLEERYRAEKGLGHPRCRKMIEVLVIFDND
jgi:hypothetical protein